MRKLIIVPTPEAELEAELRFEAQEQETEALNAIDSLYGGKPWTWEMYDRDYGLNTPEQVQSIVAGVLGLNPRELTWMTQEQIQERLKQALAPRKDARDQEQLAASRQAWMLGRRPDWGVSQWSKHPGHPADPPFTGPTYKTLQKYWSGVTTTQTLNLRVGLAKLERAAIKEVPN
jgi:hypothetical protein